MIENSIPVEAILKLAFDRAGSDEMHRFLDQHEKQWSRIESSVSRIGSGVSGISRTILGFAGVATLGAVAQQFMALGDAGSAAASAAGRVTGGRGTWAPYAGALMNVQSATGVKAQDVAQGFIGAVQMVGGRPTPGQAQILGGLLAGFGQAVGMTPGQIASVIGPMLLSSGQNLNQSAVVAATLQQGLRSYPGSQAAPILPVVAGAVASLAVGTGGAVPTSALAQQTAITETLTRLNPALFRSPEGNASAQAAITEGLRGAYANPAMQAFVQMAGIGYDAQRRGLTPSTLLALAREAERQYPDPVTRDIALRSMFGIDGANAIETFIRAGGRGERVLQQAVRAGNRANVNQLRHTLSNLQAQTSPTSTANKIAGGVMAEITRLPSQIAHGAEDVANLLTGGLFHTATGLGTNPADIGDSLAQLVTGSGPTSQRMPQSQRQDRNAAMTMVAAVVMAANQRFHGKLGPAAIDWMREQVKTREGFSYSHNAILRTPAFANLDPRQVGVNPVNSTLVDQLLLTFLKQLANSGDPNKAFTDAVKKFDDAVSKLDVKNPNTMSYQAGAAANSGAVLMSLINPGSRDLQTMLTAYTDPSTVIPGGGGGGGGNTPLKGSGNEQKVYNFLKGKGLSNTAIAGIMANLNAESTFDPTARNPNGGAYGLAQWLDTQGSPRQSNLIAFAKARGKSPSDLGVQLQFMWSELSSPSYKSALDAIKGAGTPAGAASADYFQYEGGGYSHPNIDTLPGRRAWAQNFQAPTVVVYVDGQKARNSRVVVKAGRGSTLA